MNVSIHQDAYIRASRQTFLFIKINKTPFRNEMRSGRTISEFLTYDDDPKTVALMHEHMAAEGYTLDITESRYHHEIYLSDPRKCAAEKLKIVVRHPIRKGGNIKIMS